MKEIEIIKDLIQHMFPDHDIESCLNTDTKCYYIYVYKNGTSKDDGYISCWYLDSGQDPHLYAWNQTLTSLIRYKASH